ncbi:hypothetical protein WAF17_05405 [Bernardetia sp. ABR2-2B]|uniref:hypothetical protein n=1 Tax=Bernardetia sp. ABR2-2B TaxID=3127472 RepID=UPI0030D35015
MIYLRYAIGGLIVFTLIFTIGINIITHDSAAFETAEKYINSSKLIEEKLNTPPPYRTSLSNTSSSMSFKENSRENRTYEIHVGRGKNKVFVEIKLYKNGKVWVVDEMIFL